MAASIGAHAAGRAAGLDLLRASAIALVFCYHYFVFVSGEPSFGVLSEVGWTGVDLFFVLSGYLIGNQLIGGMALSEQLHVGRFYLRRWLRTVPAYWVVLAAYTIWPVTLAGVPMPPLWRFLSFTQNIGLVPGSAFSHAWSLCIEEQFYLLLPLFLVIGASLRLGRRAAWITLSVLLLIGIGSRLALWLWCGTEASGKIGQYYTWVYYDSLTRFDEFLPGVALALVRHGAPGLWQRLISHGRLSFYIGLGATTLMLYLVDVAYQSDDYGYYFFMSVFGYSLIALAFALLVLSALSPGSPLYRCRIPGVQSIALWSYSIYLSHKAVAHVVKAVVVAQQWPSTLMLPATIALSIFVGWLLFTLVEAPVMRLRDRYFPRVLVDSKAAPAARRVLPDTATAHRH